jgi:hypothetical protein
MRPSCVRLLLLLLELVLNADAPPACLAWVHLKQFTLKQSRRIVDWLAGFKHTQQAANWSALSETLGDAFKCSSLLQI